MPVTIPLRVSLPVFVVFWVCVATLVSFLPVYFRAVETVDETSVLLIDTLTGRIQDQLQEFFASPVRLTSHYSDIFARGYIDISANSSDLRTVACDILRAATHDFAAVYFGLAVGTFSGCQGNAQNLQSLTRTDTTGGLRIDNVDNATYQETSHVVLVPGYDHRQRPWYPPVLERQSWSSLYVDSGDSSQVDSTLGFPVFVGTTKVGAFAIDISTAGVANFLSSMTISKTGYAVVFDANELVIATTWGAAVTRDDSALPFGGWVVIPLSDLTPHRSVEDFREIGGIQNAITQFKSQPSKDSHIRIERGGFYFTLGSISDDNALELYFTVVVPKADFFEEINERRTITIIVVCVAVALVMLFSFLAGKFLLRPLRTTADHMTTFAACLDSSDVPFSDSISSVSEVALIQKSYLKLRDELLRLKGFVPQALMEQDSGMSTDENPLSGQRGKTDSAVNMDTHGGHGTRQTLQSDKLTGKDGFTQKRYTVMYIEVHSVATDDPTVASQQVYDFMNTTLPIVLGHFGVIDLFGANTLLVTFGCHSTMTLHEDAACRCALALRDALDSYRDIEYTVTVDTGYNLVGNCGIESRKARVSMGESVDLVRMLPALQRFIGVRVLVTQQTVTAIDFETIPVDVVDPCWPSSIAGTRKTNIRVFELVSVSRPPDALHSVGKAFASLTDKKFAAAAQEFAAATYKSNESVQVQRLGKLAQNLSELGAEMKARKQYIRLAQGWEVFTGETKETEALKAVKSPAASTRAHKVGIVTDMDEVIQTMKKNQKPAVELQEHSEGLFATFTAPEEDEDEELNAQVLECVTDNNGVEWKRAKKVLTTVGNGTTSVFLALGPQGHLVVLKAINLKCREMQDLSVEELVAEVQTLASIRHNNIVGYISCAVTKNHFSFLMEYVAGGSLRNLIDEFGPAPLRAARRYVHDILLGLECLHNHGIAHCDIKPHNVLLGQDGSCKLTDFGSAVQTHFASTSLAASSAASNSSSASASTTSGMRSAFNSTTGGNTLTGGTLLPQTSVLVRGTAFYMSPEACRGDICLASDTWSVGITMLEIMTGKLPWRTKKSEAAFIQLLSKDDLLVPTIPDNISDSAKDFLARCFVRDPERRATVQDLLNCQFFM